ncbi:hypothetical protein LAZ67_X001466 [Cordylochernes scorpioides]|uniref:Mos1 transposase HTH domain-containing protein n=1 Tax=Cordylochernes scorpioides TaxID=51811 RepID=A0ABY6LWP1_9ARAC|nr:hypothetical protein LAZ67_X001466 [Cordylochernes scorpioides]
MVNPMEPDHNGRREGPTNGRSVHGECIIPFWLCDLDVSKGIRFMDLRVPPIEINRQLVEVYGEKCMEVKNVRKWCQSFLRAGKTFTMSSSQGGRVCQNQQWLESTRWCAITGE